MTSETLTLDAPTIIRRAAKLIEEHGWLMVHGATAAQMGVPGIGITTALCWAAHGERCQARDLTGSENELVADALDLLDTMLQMPVSLYERRMVGAPPTHVSHDLRGVAWILSDS